MTTLQGVRPEIGTRIQLQLERLFAKKAGVFISYRRDDTTPVAKQIAEHLSKLYGQDQIFFDQQAIACGDEFSEKIVESLKHCFVLIAVIGDKWNPSTGSDRTRLDDPDDFVRIEIQTALQRKIDVIPLLVDQAPLPNAQQLPHSLQLLNRYQALRIGRLHVEAQLSPLVTRVKHLLSLRKITTIIKTIAVVLLFGIVALGAKNPAPAKWIGATALDLGGWHLSAARWYNDIEQFKEAEISYRAELESLDPHGPRYASIECELASNLSVQRQSHSAKVQFMGCTEGLKKQLDGGQLKPIEERELRLSLAGYYWQLAGLIESTDESESRYRDAANYYIAAAELYAEEGTNNKYWALTLKNLGSLHKGNRDFVKARQCLAASLEKLTQKHVFAELSEQDIETLNSAVASFVKLTSEPAPEGISADSCLA